MYNIDDLCHFQLGLHLRLRGLMQKIVLDLSQYMYLNIIWMVDRKAE